MGIREGKWRCKACSGVNRGRDLGCVGCGQPRGDVEFFLDDDAPLVTDRGLLARANAGTDWVCAYCSSANASGTKTCGGCGGPRDEGKKRREGPVVTAAREPVRGARGRSLAQQSLAVSSVGSIPSADASWLPKLFSGLAVGCAAVLLLFCALSAMVGRAVTHSSPIDSSASSLAAVADAPRQDEPPPPPPPRPEHVAAVVTNVSWERTIQTERLRAFEEKGRAVPAGARLLGEEQATDGHREVKTGTRTVTKTKTVQTGTKNVTKTKRVQTGTRQVKVGTRSKGNGFFEDVYRTEKVYGDRQYTEAVPVYGPRSYTEEVPVYERRPILVTVYRYEVRRWVQDEDHVERGTGTTPAWPLVAFDSVTRERGRSERLSVSFECDGGARRHWSTPSCASIATFTPGSRWELVVSHRGEVLSVNDPPVVGTWEAAPVTSEH